MNQKINDWGISLIQKNKSLICILTILISLTIVAIIPLKYALPAVDLQNFDDAGQWPTASALKFVNNWLTDGIINDNFIMYEDFASVEFEKNLRNTYVSYPSGSIIPLFLAAKLTGRKEVSISFIKHFVQLEYYLSILFLGLLLYTCLKLLDVSSLLLRIGLPIILSYLWAFLPYNFYYMKNVYFSDQAVILLSIIFFLIEIILYKRQLNKWNLPLQILSNVILFLGILTDWYFCFIAFAAFCLRVITAFQEYPTKPILFILFSKTWTLVISVVTAIGLFIIQIVSIPGGVYTLGRAFFYRTSSGAEYGGIETLIYRFKMGFSWVSIPLLIFTVVFCIVFLFKYKNYSRKLQMIFSWLSLIVLSAILHTITFRNHTIVHEFSMLKYNFVFVFVIFTFICWIYIKNKNKIFLFDENSSGIIIIFTGCLLLSFFSLLKTYDQMLYKARSREIIDHSIAKFIRGNTNYYDIVYSPDYEINPNPPQELAISKKRVYKILTVNEIPYRSLPHTAIINILISKKTIEDNNWSKLQTKNISYIESDSCFLFKFSLESFQLMIDTK